MSGGNGGGNRGGGYYPPGTGGVRSPSGPYGPPGFIGGDAGQGSGPPMLNAQGTINPAWASSPALGAGATSRMHK